MDLISRVVGLLWIHSLTKATQPHCHWLGLGRDGSTQRLFPQGTIRAMLLCQLAVAVCLGQPFFALGAFAYLYTGMRGH